MARPRLGAMCAARGSPPISIFPHQGGRGYGSRQSALTGRRLRPHSITVIPAKAGIQGLGRGRPRRADAPLSHECSGFRFLAALGTTPHHRPHLPRPRRRFALTLSHRRQSALTGGRPRCYTGMALIGRPGDRSDFRRGGKSELHRAGCWLTARRGNPTESATENTPPRLRGKGEPARQELTAPVATPGARQTPPGARPNRRTMGARPVLGLAARGAWQRASQIDDRLPPCGGIQNSAYRPAYQRLGGAGRQASFPLMWEESEAG